LNAPVLKTVRVERLSGVRIPLPPPFQITDNKKVTRTTPTVASLRYSWGVRDIYVRHRNDCRRASPNPKKPTRLPARLTFGCGCPIYARLHVRHPDPTIAPFEFNGSLSKLGVREKLAAEELVEQWTVRFLSTGGRTPDPNTFKSVEQATQSVVVEPARFLSRASLQPAQTQPATTSSLCRPHLLQTPSGINALSVSVARTAGDTNNAASRRPRAIMLDRALRRLAEKLGVTWSRDSSFTRA
jgi:hypothetical protein